MTEVRKSRGRQREGEEQGRAIQFEACWLDILLWNPLKISAKFVET